MTDTVHLTIDRMLGLLGHERLADPFRDASGQAQARADRMLRSSLALTEEDGADQREQLRRATQDLQDVTQLLCCRLEAGYQVGADPWTIIERYAGEYAVACEAWHGAIGAVLDQVGSFLRARAGEAA